MRGAVLACAAVGSGRAAAGFVRRLRGLDVGIQVVVVCGEAQRRAVKRGGGMTRGLRRLADPNVSMVALRLLEGESAGGGRPGGSTVQHSPSRLI
jgi:hypothetical protein